MKLLIYKNLRFLWEKYSLNTEFGKIEEKDILNAKTKVKTHLGHEFQIYEPTFKDLLRKFKRGPAIILPKDIGFIIAYTGINKSSIVAEAGSGSGFLTAHLASISKKVYSYEKSKEFYEKVKHNLSLLSLKNVQLYNKDILELSQKEIDTIILDLPNPEEYLKVCFNSLKRNSYLVCYLPQITQIQKLVKENKDFKVEKIVEIIEREWEIDNIRARPSKRTLNHTAFLVFLKKY